MVTHGEVDGIGSGHVVRSASVCPGDVGLVVAEVVGTGLVALVVIHPGRAEVFECPLPERFPRVDVSRAEHVDTFDEEASPDDLFRGAVPVSRKDIVVIAAAEPEQAEREFHELIFGLDRVGHVPVQVGPSAGSRQRSLP